MVLWFGLKCVFVIFPDHTRLLLGCCSIKAVVSLCTYYCLWGFCVLSLFCYALLCVLSSFAITIPREREMFALL